MAAKEERTTPRNVKDGRVVRGERNREAIVEAMFELVSETHLAPSIEEVAKRAGVGPRTVFRQFQDIDSLYRSLGERVLRGIQSLITRPIIARRLEEDVEALVARRAKVYEYITPFRRASRLVRYESAFLKADDDRATLAFRATMLLVLAPYLGKGTEDTVEALDALLSYEAWERVRGPQGLSVKRAQLVLAAATLALVKSGSVGQPSARSRRKRAPRSSKTE